VNDIALLVFPILYRILSFGYNFINADFSIVQAVLIDLRFGKYCTYMLQLIVYEHYSLEKCDVPKDKV
jgi:hypothetical protein